MKVIFLDIDGVLNSQQFFIKLNQIYSGTGVYPAPEDKLDPELILRLNRLVMESGAKIVVSSSWRIGYHRNLAGLRELFRKRGIVGDVLGITVIDGRIRGLQIREWLETWQRVTEPVESFVILDDDSDMGPVLDRLVKTSNETGLTDGDVERALKMLNTPLQ